MGDGRAPIENATLVVDGTRIVQAGGAADVRVPAGAARVSLAGKTVMPMLIDTHVHLSPTRELVTRDLKRRAYFGVSAVLSMGTDNYDLLDMRSQTIPGAARFFSAGRGITMPEPGRITVPHWITTEAEARKAVQELAERKVDIVKVWVDDRDGKYKKVTPEIYGAIIDEAHKNGLRVSAHIFNMEDAKGLMRAGLDAFAHGVRDKDIDDETVAMFKQRPNLILTPNLPDRGVKVDLSWLRPGLPAAEFEKLEAANTDRPQAQALLRDSGAQPGEAERGRRAHHARHRRQQAVGCARGDGGHGDRRDDADAGDRGGDAQLGRVPADGRRGHAGSGQERRLHRARCQPARRHHQHATHLVGVPARRGRGPRAAGAVRYVVSATSPDVKIATFNINNVNKRLRNLLDWLRAAKPDVVCLQELKATNAEFPKAAIEQAGYGAAWRGQETWNGVAILARDSEPIVTRTELPGDPADTQSRYIEAAVNGVIVTSLYAPNGNPQPGPKFDYKLAWLQRLAAHAADALATGVPVVLAGDYNVVPTDRDIYPTKSWAKDALVQPESRAAFRRILAQGWVDAIRAHASRRADVHATGTTSGTAGRAMPACASTICC